MALTKGYSIPLNVEWSDDAFEQLKALFEPKQVDFDVIEVKDHYLTASIPTTYDTDMDAVYMIDGESYAGVLKAGESEVVMRKVVEST